VISSREGGLIGIIGGFDFLASLASIGRFSSVVGFDIAPSQVVVGAIRAALCEISPTPSSYLYSLLSMDIDEEDVDDLHSYFEESCYENPQRFLMERTWTSLKPLLEREKSISLDFARDVWEEMFGLYRGDGVRKTSIVTGESVNLYLRELQEVNLRRGNNHGSWLSSQGQYDQVRRLISSGNLTLMTGDLFDGGVEKADAHLKEQGVPCGVVYVSNVPTYAHPSDVQLGSLESLKARLGRSGVYVTDGSHGRGLTSRTYKKGF